MMKIYVPSHPSLVSVEKFFRVSSATDDLEKVAEITGKKISDIKHYSLETIDNIISIFESGMKKDIAPINRIMKIRTGLFSWVRLGFIPDMNELSYYEYVDIDQFARDYIKGNNDKLIELACVLFRPITWKFGKRYSIREYDAKKTSDYRHAIELMKMDQVLNAVFFFSNIRRELQETTNEFLETTLENQMKIVNQID